MEILKSSTMFNSKIGIKTFQCPTIRTAFYIFFCKNPGIVNLLFSFPGYLLTFSFLYPIYNYPKIPYSLRLNYFTTI